jgi:hypothetical protein
MGVVDDRLLRQWEFSKAQHAMSRRIVERRVTLLAEIVDRQRLAERHDCDLRDAIDVFPDEDR